MVQTSATGRPGIDHSAVAEDIIPKTDDTYDLGSATKRWALLYVVMALLGSLVIGGTVALTTTTFGLIINDSTQIQGDLIIDNNLTAINITSSGFYFGNGSKLTGVIKTLENIFDQVLNTSSNVQFQNLILSGNFTVLGNQTILNVTTLSINGSALPGLDNWFDLGSNTLRWRNLFIAGDLFSNGSINAIDWTNVTITESQISNLKTYVINNTDGWNVNFTTLQANAYFTDSGAFSFNYYDDGSEFFWNLTSIGDAINFITDNSKIVLFNSPVAGNDFKVFQVFSKEAQDTTEFVITKAKDQLTSYFVRSLALVGNGTQIGTPHNCSTFANFIDCKTDVTGPDFYVLDDVEINGSLWVGDGNFNVSDSGNIRTSGNLTVGPLTLFVNSILNRIGIGTSTPQNTLNVIGSINATATIFSQNYNLTDGYLYAINGSLWSLNYSTFLPLTDDSMVDALHRHSKLSASDGSPGDALIVDSVGNIKFKRSLELGRGQFNTWITNENNPFIYATGAVGSYPFDFTGNLVIQPRSSSAASDLILATGASTPTPRIVIEGTGNVGIGTISPQNKLNVVGSINATIGFIVNSSVGFTGSCGSGTTLTIVGGIIIACS